MKPISSSCTKQRVMLKSQVPQLCQLLEQALLRTCTRNESCPILTRRRISSGGSVDSLAPRTNSMHSTRLHHYGMTE